MSVADTHMISEIKPIRTPNELTLADLLRRLPSDVFQRSSLKAFKALVYSISFAIVGYYIASFSLWFFMPLVWMFLGAVYVGLCSIAHDCGKNSFSKHLLVNSIVGTIVSWPLLVPFESWRLNYQYQQFEDMFHNLALGKTWWAASTLEWVRSNFILSFVWANGNKTRIVTSIVCLWVYGLIFFPAMVYYIGVWGLVKFWFIPWLAYHLWMSSFIQTVYKPPVLQSTGTLHVDLNFPAKYPEWLELITNDINLVLAYTRSMSDACVQVGTQKIPNHNMKKMFNSMRGATLELHESAKEKLIWLSTGFIVATPLIAIYGLLTTPLQLNTLLLLATTYYLGGLGITIGYHRLWSHRAFETILPVRIFLMLCGSSAFEGSVIWWASHHRSHHRYIGTDRDSYNIKKGFWWAHLGWLMYRRAPPQEDSTVPPIIDDLKADPILQFQHTYFNFLAILTGMVVPTLVAGYGWGDFWGGFYFAAVLRTVLVFHCTCCFNSVVNYIGTFTFSDDLQPRDSWLVSLFTFGEGYNNFHHEFPRDYRNGVNRIAYDPAKWIISGLEKVGLASNVKRTPNSDILKAQIIMRQKKADELKSRLDFGPKIESLKQITFEEYQNVGKEKKWIAVDNLVFDLSKFHDSHPGGQKILNAYYGKEATNAFNGTIYNHSNGARNLSRTFLIARITETKEE